MTPAEEFAKLNNIHWHEEAEDNLHVMITRDGNKVPCKHCGIAFFDDDNPTFSIQEILGVMMKREDRGGGFFNFLFFKAGIEITGVTSIIIPLCHILEKGKLFAVSIEFCREHPLKEGLMRNVIEETIVRHRVVSLVCDCCKKEFDNDMDLQEFLCHYNTGGYSSVFGDGAIMSLELCQDCVNKLLGDYIQFHGKEELSTRVEDYIEKGVII